MFYVKNYTPEEKEALTARLQQFYETFQHSPSHREFRGTTTYERAFGSWNNALNTAGLPTRVRGHKEVKCAYCGRVFIKLLSQIIKCKNDFCTSACNARFHNKTHRHIQRSKAEFYLEGHLRSNFPRLAIEVSARYVLPSGLEIDLYLPAVHLAIELNGPLHYLPIYGADRLKDYQRKDALKKAEAEQMGLTFVVLNIAVCKSWKGTRDLLDKEFDHLNFIIRERLSDLSC